MAAQELKCPACGADNVLLTPDGYTGGVRWECGTCGAPHDVAQTAPVQPLGLDAPEGSLPVADADVAAATSAQ